MTTRARWVAATVLALLLIQGSAHAKKDRDPGRSGWRALATPEDRERMRGWRDSWVGALAQANRSAAARIAAEGALLAPDAAIAPADPPLGEFKCRVIKLGAPEAGAPTFVDYPVFRCRIAADGPGLVFTKLTGSQRPIGQLLPESSTRMMFLGTMMLGDERRPQGYGNDPDRDMIGFLERVSAQRWRLVLPKPRWESLLDVIELVPAD